jgi:hypothetical protein
LSSELATKAVISASQNRSDRDLITGRLAISSESEDSVYVSFAPGSLPLAKKIEVENSSRHSAPVTAVVRDGGVDPVSVGGAEGDTLRITAWTADGKSGVTMIKVPSKRPPSVVRTNPPRGRTDVPLNIIITVVFTEPINRGTVTASSLRLLRDGRVVPGKFFIHDEGWLVDFLPDDALLPRTSYNLVVTNEITDRNGSALEQLYSSSFMTGTERCTLEQSECQTGSIPPVKVVTGTVSEWTPAGVVPLRGAQVSAWIQEPGGGYMLNGIVTNEDGSYTIRSLPDALVIVGASSSGLEQHCSTYATTYGVNSVTADVLLSPRGRFAGVTQPGPSPLKGIVEVHPMEWFGAFPYGPPIPDVTIKWEAPEGFVALTATTDTSGVAVFCRVPSLPNTRLTITKSGFNGISFLMNTGEGAGGIWMGMTRQSQNH